MVVEVRCAKLGVGIPPVADELGADDLPGLVVEFQGFVENQRAAVYLRVAASLARFSRTVSMLLIAGVTPAAALELGTKGCKNQVLQKVFADADESLMNGHGLASALKRHPILPGMFIQLVMIGEESNSLDKTITDAAETSPSDEAVTSGTVSFVCYENGECEGDREAQTGPYKLTGGNGGVAHVDGFDQTPAEVGLYFFRARYNGSSTYDAKWSACELLSVIVD